MSLTEISICLKPSHYSGSYQFTVITVNQSRYYWCQFIIFIKHTCLQDQFPPCLQGRKCWVWRSWKHNTLRLFSLVFAKGTGLSQHIKGSMNRAIKEPSSFRQNTEGGSWIGLPKWQWPKTYHQHVNHLSLWCNAFFSGLSVHILCFCINIRVCSFLSKLAKLQIQQGL